MRVQIVYDIDYERDREKAEQVFLFCLLTLHGMFFFVEFPLIFGPSVL